MNEEIQKPLKHGMDRRMSEDMRSEFIQKVLLNHCECGMPEESLKYIQKILNLLNHSEPQDFEALGKIFYHDEGLKYTVYYMFHKYGLTDHVDSVPGKLTEKGRELLADLNKLYPRDLEEVL